MGLAHGFAVAAGALVAGIWESCVLVACVALALRLIPGIPARARSVVWLAVMGLVVALPFLHLGRGPAAGSGGGVQAGFGWTLALAVVWMGMSLVRAGRLVWSALVLRGIARRARVVEISDEIAGLLDGRAVVCASDEVSVPSVAGFFAPRILLPAGILERLSNSDLRQIVVHEREHLRRRDDWVNLLQKVSLVVFPLNPALVWVERRLCAERELACDDAVIRATGSAKAYASCLASLAEHTLVRRGVSLALGAWERRPELARRVARILARPQGEMRYARVVVAVLLVGVAGGAGELSRAPRLIGFADGSAPVAASMAEPVKAPVAGGRMVLASAVMPAPARLDGLVGDGVVAAKKPASPKRVVKHPAPIRPEEVTKAAHPVLRQLAMDEDLMPRRVLLSFDEDSQVSFAAVPVRNGWLIFQL